MQLESRCTPRNAGGKRSKGLRDGQRGRTSMAGVASRTALACRRAWGCSNTLIGSTDLAGRVTTTISPAMRSRRACPSTSYPSPRGKRWYGCGGGSWLARRDQMRARQCLVRTSEPWSTCFLRFKLKTWLEVPHLDSLDRSRAALNLC